MALFRREQKPAIASYRPANEAELRNLRDVAGHLWLQSMDMSADVRLENEQGLVMEIDRDQRLVEFIQYYKLLNKPPFNALAIYHHSRRTMVREREVRPATYAEGSAAVFASDSTYWPLNNQCPPFRIHRLLSRSADFFADQVMLDTPPPDAHELEPISSGKCKQFVEQFSLLRQLLPPQPHAS